MSLERELETLHNTYVGAVNAAVEQNDHAGADRLAHEYEDEALQLILGARAA